MTAIKGYTTQESQQTDALVSARFHLIAADNLGLHTAGIFATFDEATTYALPAHKRFFAVEERTNGGATLVRTHRTREA